VRSHALGGFVARDRSSEWDFVFFENLRDLDQVVYLKAESADTDIVERRIGLAGCRRVEKLYDIQKRT
jgi:hypothetical protein